MLSAQCTDERVNKVTPILFSKYNSPKDLVNIDISTLENIIHSCGFYKNKAKNIKAYARKILEDFNGNVPMDIESLITLPGIGRKSANVIMLEAFNIASGIAVDTHVSRLSNRIGLSSNSNPEKIENDLKRIIPSELFKHVNHLLIYHGRAICTSRSPKCNVCPINKLCKFYAN